MSKQIQDLAQLIRVKQKAGEKFVLILGAGASIDSGVPPTSEIVEKLLMQHGKNVNPSKDTHERFQEFWKDTNESEQTSYLRDYLGVPPSDSYRKLAELMARGFFDLVITFNFDNLLEKSFELDGFSDFREIVRHTTSDDAISKLIDNSEKRVSIFHVHGSLRDPSTLLFTDDELAEYPEEIISVLADQSSKDVIVCGYAFEDLSVLTSFAKKGGYVYCVNPDGAPQHLKTIQRGRKSSERTFEGDIGRFNQFVDALHTELLIPEIPSHAIHRSKNPFKFIASHDADDKHLFVGRRQETLELIERLKGKPKSLHIVGRKKVGKTSLIRARLIPNLDSDIFETVYIRRCGREIDKTLPIRLTGNGDDAEDNISAALGRLSASHENKHIVLILDQFERALEGVGNADDQKLMSMLNQILRHNLENLTIVPVVSRPVPMNKDYFAFLMAEYELGPKPVFEVKALSKTNVVRIIRGLSQTAGIGLGQEFIDELGECYGRTIDDDDRSFTLAHIQSVCYLVAMKIADGEDAAQTQRMPEDELRGALDTALLKMDVTSYVEDFPQKAEQNLLRNIIRVSSDPSKQKIARYVGEHFRELLREAEKPDRHRGVPNA